ncbi:polyribonucleotide nucleotidyltransferase [Candidatus Bipolaricaulota bacterium]|nr:polyribonucleotide nucleotidyltransferase [Candidatus Bipolaricaulota bacterium]
MYKQLETEIDESIFNLETGKMARQADGSVVSSLGDTKVLVTATSGGESDKPYFPLRVDYEEKFYAGGKIPGGFIKREGRPSDKAVLNARMIDRPIRPLFPDEFMEELHIVVTVLSASEDYSPGIAGMIGASAALTLSDMPFQGPIAGVDVGRVDGEFILNPTAEQREESDLEITVAGTGDAVTMVEGGMEEVAEEDVIEAVNFAHERIKQLVEFQLKFTETETQVNSSKSKERDEIEKKTANQIKEYLPDLLGIENKLEREERVDEIKEEIKEKILEDEDLEEANVNKVEDTIDEEYKKFARRKTVKEGVRIDGRKPDEIRPINVEVGLLDRAHGSSLFTRGETQSLGTATLGTTKQDEQRIDGMVAEGSKRFMLHYNFPPYSVGEAGYMSGPGRREKGHGHLAETALSPVLPDEEEFPYIIRVVSEVLESNGSSSMATVCSGSLALMDSGVPIEKPVAGIGVGLMEEGGEYRILTDIMGKEDHFGDMDFKVTGTRDGVTAFQLDVKVGGITEEIMREAMDRAYEARLEVLDKMDKAISEPRGEVSKYAPVMEVFNIDEDEIGTVIGPGGRTIRDLTEETETEIDIDDDGTVKLSGVDREGVEKAKQMIEDMTREVEPGEEFVGEVVRVEDFGAFVQLPNKSEGLVHISKLSDGYVDNVEDITDVGEEMRVKVIGHDDQGRLDLKRIGEPKDDLEVGDVTDAEITKTADFGAFIETPGGETGLIHISELSRDYVKNVQDVVEPGDRVKVELINIDEKDRYQFRLIEKN